MILFDYLFLVANKNFQLAQLLSRKKELKGGQLRR
jgi:hypothetical protein